MSTIQSPFTGGCSCGAIRYESTANPAAMLQCHCTDCQQSSGGPFSSFVVVPKAAFRFTKGKPHFYDSPSEGGGENHRGYCLECGSPIVSTPDPAPEIVAIRAASLDDPSGYQPTMDVWMCDALPWTVTSPATTKFDKYPG